MTLLKVVDGLALPDCWIAAGVIRNAVWDELHRHPEPATPPNDIDVIYFDPANIDPGRDTEFENRLRVTMPGQPWQVRNQARMHQRNHDRPYTSSEDAISHYPETATAIAARLEAGRIALIAPFGIDDLIDLIVRPTPAFGSKMDIYRTRIAAKNWAATWPRLTIL